MLETVAGDLRFAARMLRKSPLFTFVAVLCISLGSGAVTTIFSALNAMVLRPLPGAADAARLVRMERKEPGKQDGVSASYPYYAYLRDRTHTLDGVAAWTKASLTVRRGSDAGTTIYGNLVSGNFFSLLGVRPMLGRFFVADEARTEMTHPVIVVSEGFWRVHLAGDSSALGRDVMVNGQRFTLIGVAPGEFRGVDDPIRTDAWLPLQMQRALKQDNDALSNAGVITLRLAGRLKSGASADEAHRELSAITAAFGAEGKEASWLHKYDDVRLSALTGLPPDATTALAGFLGLLLGAAVLVLLIASVNVAAMLSARAIARRREMAVRAALGAARSRLVRQLLTEMLVLFVAGAAGGAVIAVVATNAFERMPIPAEIPIVLELSPDPRVFAFTLLVSLVTGLVVGLAPARRGATPDIAARLRDGTSGGGTRRGLLGNVLIVGQLALSLVLLVGAGLFVRALQRGSRIDPGFNPTQVSTVALDTRSWGYDETQAIAFSQALRERVESISGVTAVSYASRLPLGLSSGVDDGMVDGSSVLSPSDRFRLNHLEIDAGYFDVLRIPLLAGRAIARTDDARAPRVAVVNETFAQRFWPKGSALGHTLRMQGQQFTIVGVARDAKYASLTEATPALAYFSLAQQPQPKQVLIVRASTDARALAPEIQRAMRSVDEGIPRGIVTPLREAMALGLLPQRVAALVTGALGVVGLLLATVGLYGIIAYSASRRSREIGIRLALGARREDVLGMVVREGMRLTTVGVGIGLLLAAAATRLIVGFLFGVSPLDGLTYVAMTAGFVAVALLASWLPARRAAATDPMVVLRGE